MSGPYIDTVCRPGVVLRPNPGIDPRTVRSLRGVVGSFDPLHRGHQWMVQLLLARFEAVLLLVPARHFSKTVCPPRNATLDQRLEMIQRVYPPGPGSRVLCGVATEVLFIRLASVLAESFPAAELSFGMGNDTFGLLLDSASYYRTLGLPWGEAEQRQLRRLRRRVVVFGRSTTGATHVPVPHQLRQVSSTRVRRVAGALWRAQAPAGRWAAELRALVAPPIIRYLREHQLYGETTDVAPP